MPNRRLARLAGPILACLCLTPAHADAAERFALELETAAVRAARNDVRIPADTGTRFDMTTVTGANAGPAFRLGAYWRIDDRHRVRAVLAPLSLSGDGTLDEDTAFDGETFAAGDTEGTYQFKTYKLTYRYTLSDEGRLRWGLGFTAVVRDAKIELRQGARVATNENVGFVPTLHLSGDYRLSARWSLAFDLDALAGGPGRLVDLGLKARYAPSDRWQIGAGYRTIEGGADTDELFTFAWLNYALLDLRYRF